jgi:hypothetical protein
VAQPYTLLLGFSYSLDPDGAPGSYNRAISAAMQQWLSNHDSAGVLVAAQWEIVDALGEHYNGPPPFAVPPPAFTTEDIADADALIHLLKNPATPAARHLADTLCDLLQRVGYAPAADGQEKIRILDQVNLTTERLAIYLNRLLDQTTFYTAFQGNVELHHLLRPAFGALGFEKRELPTGNAPLLPLQKKRINRLIIEAIVADEKILRRGSYLSTQGVLDRVLLQFQDKLGQIGKVQIFGFPAHSPLCRRLSIESLWKQGCFIDPQNVIDVSCQDPSQWHTLPWDANTAQIWCKSLQNWLDYVKLWHKQF